METITTLLILVGALCVFFNLFFGIVEVFKIRTIRPPKQQTFNYIRLAAGQFRTVSVPAVGALFSGLAVSISASFFYESFIEEDGSWKSLVGGIIFLLGFISLVITLGPVLKNVGEPLELARDPFSIRAAADESAAEPRNGGINPEVLAKQLDEWNRHISARSMNLKVNSNSARLDKKLSLAVTQLTLRGIVSLSFEIYYAALLRFPFRFMWPILGFSLFLVGIVGSAVGPAELPFLTPWNPWVKVGVLVMLAAIFTLFYCVMRGNRARLWHRINLHALEEARNAIRIAREAHTMVADEDALLKRVLGMADKFLQQDHTTQDKPDRTILRLGRFRLSKD